MKTEESFSHRVKQGEREVRKAVESELKAQERAFEKFRTAYLKGNFSFHSAVEWGDDGLIAEALVMFCSGMLNVDNDELIEQILYDEKCFTKSLIKLWDSSNSTSALTNAANHSRNKAKGRMVEYIGRLRKQFDF